MKKSKLNTYPPPSRLSYPEAEQKNTWLPLLFDSYHISDKAVHEGILKRVRNKEKLACAKGCSTCCSTHTTIPVYPMEMLGIFWYVTEVIDNRQRMLIRNSVKDYQPTGACPFLIEGICLIHQVRPMACRYFNVFNRICAPGEDPFYTRKQDVLIPSDKMKNKALENMLVLHGVKDRQEKKAGVKNGYVHTFAQNLQSVDWGKLADRIDAITS